MRKTLFGKTGTFLKYATQRNRRESADIRDIIGRIESKFLGYPIVLIPYLFLDWCRVLPPGHLDHARHEVLCNRLQILT